MRLPDATNEEKLTFNFFKGFVPFSPLELSDEKNWDKVWTAAYKNADKAGMPYRMVTLSPGYDDTGLDADVRIGNPYRKIDRKEGATYQKSMQFVEELPTPPHLVMISTFNEFHENTHIEPSLRHGMHYIDMTRDFIARIKAKWGQSRRTLVSQGVEAGSMVHFSAPEIVFSNGGIFECSLSPQALASDLSLVIDIYDLDHPVHPGGTSGVVAISCESAHKYRPGINQHRKRFGVLFA